MSSVCISNCVNDARDPRVPVRATYVNLYKWPESDAEFVRSVTRANMRQAHGSGGSGNHHHHHCRPRVVDSISCRQMYLRSYTFSREEDNVSEKSTKCFGGVKEKTAANGENNRSNSSGRKRRKKEKRRRKCYVARKMKEISCSALLRIFYRLLSCSASVDVADH